MVDRQMSPSQWSPRLGADAVIASHCEVLASHSAAAIATATDTPGLLVRLDCMYATSADGTDLTLDLLLPEVPSGQEPTLIFYLHGGMWQALGKRDSLFFAPPFLARGIGCVAVEYQLAPLTSMTTIVEQVAAALIYTHITLPSYKLYLLGHSAGGHLAAMMLTQDWSNVPTLPACLKGCIPVSGLFDLEPVRRCYANDALQLTDAEVATLSPLLLACQQRPHLKSCTVGFHVITGVRLKGRCTS